MWSVCQTVSVVYSEHCFIVPGCFLMTENHTDAVVVYMGVAGWRVDVGEGRGGCQCVCVCVCVCVWLCVLATLLLLFSF